MLALLIFAIPLELIGNVSPSPHGDYLACPDPKATVCVETGAWWGICRDKQFGAAEKSIKSGALSLENKQAEFSACPFYQALFAKRIEAQTHARRHPIAQLLSHGETAADPAFMPAKQLRDLRLG